MPVSLISEWNKRLWLALSRSKNDRGSLLVRVLSFLINTYPNAREYRRTEAAPISVFKVPFLAAPKAKPDYRGILQGMANPGANPVAELELRKSDRMRETIAIILLIVLT